MPAVLCQLFCANCSVSAGAGSPPRSNYGVSDYGVSDYEIVRMHVEAIAEPATPNACPSLTGAYRLVPLTCGLSTDTAGPVKTRKRSPWGHRIAPAPAAAPARVTAGLCRWLMGPAAAATACRLSVDGAAQTMKRCGHGKRSRSLEREGLSGGGPSSLSEGGLSEPVGELVWRQSVDRGRRTAFSLP